MGQLTQDAIGILMLLALDVIRECLMLLNDGFFNLISVMNHRKG